MSVRAMEGTRLAALARMAIPIARAAERECPRGRGRRPDYPDWQIMVLALVAVLAKRRSKSAQYRFLLEHRTDLRRRSKLKRFPARSTYFERYKKVSKLIEVAIRMQGHRMIRDGCVDATIVAVDESVMWAKGPEWHHSDWRRTESRRGSRCRSRCHLDPKLASWLGSGVRIRSRRQCWERRGRRSSDRVTGHGPGQ